MRTDTKEKLILYLGDEVLMHLSQFPMPDESVTKVRNGFSSSNLDWDKFLYDARRHHLLGFIHYNASKHNLPLPEQIAREARKYAIIWSTRLKFLFREIVVISKELATKGESALLMKGPVMIRRVFDGRAIRSVSDIDLFTLSENLEGVAQCLHALGYGYQGPEGRLAGTKAVLRSLHPEEAHLPPFTKKKMANVYPAVELHFGARYGCYDIEAIMATATREKVFGPGLLIPSECDMVIHAAYHFYHHTRFPPLVGLPLIQGATPNPLFTHVGALKLLADLYACISRFLSFNSWDSVMVRAEEVGASEILTYAIHYLQLFYGDSLLPNYSSTKTEKFRVPLFGSGQGVVVEVPDYQNLVKTKIKTHSAIIGPEDWLLHSDSVSDTITKLVRDWKGKGRPYSYTTCKRIEDAQDSISRLPDNEWEKADRISIDEDQVDPNQFFLTHISGGERPIESVLRGYFLLLWDRECLHFRVDVECADLHHVEPSMICYGEAVNIYLSMPTVVSTQIQRLGLRIAPGSLVIADVNPSSNISPSYMRAVNLDDSSYRLEFGILWRHLLVEPEDGLVFGLDVEIVHRTPEGILKTAIAWAGGELLSGHCADVHGYVSLQA